MEEEKTLTVEYLGTLTGDKYKTSTYVMNVGEEYDVSETEALRLHNDFPTHFKIEGFASSNTRSTGPANKELKDYTRAELNKMAKELGVEGAEDLPNKAAVVRAIEEAKEDSLP